MVSTRFLTAALSLFASVVCAAPIVQRTSALKPQSIASTAWSGSSGRQTSGVRIYTPINGGIQEIIARKGGLSEQDQDWDKGTFLSSKAYTVANDAPIFAVNTFAIGFSDVHVFFLSEDKTIRNWVYAGGVWNQGDFAAAVPNYSGSLSANVYPVAGGYAISVFYTENGGYIQEFQRINNNWISLGSPGKITNGVAFTTDVSVVNDAMTKKIWTADNVQLTWTVNTPTWVTAHGVTSYAAKYIAGVMLPGNDMRFYVSSGYDATINEYRLTNSVWNKEPYTIKEATSTSGSRISVATQNYEGKNWVYVFYLNEQNTLEVSVYNGEKWHDNDDTVEA